MLFLDKFALLMIFNRRQMKLNIVLWPELQNVLEQSLQHYQHTLHSVHSLQHTFHSVRTLQQY